MWTVYCLKLQENKYYVGRTREIHVEITDFDRKIDWLKRYRPVSVLYTKNNCTLYDERNILENEMRNRGINNVRGGDYTSLLLSDEDIQKLTRKILSQAFIRPLCDNCGKVGHYSIECRESEIYCYTCGKSGHTSTYCDKDFLNEVNILENEDTDDGNDEKKILPYDEILTMTYGMRVIEQDDSQLDDSQTDGTLEESGQTDDILNESEYDFCDDFCDQ